MSESEVHVLDSDIHHQASDLENSYIGDDRDIVVDIGQISDPSYYLDLLFSLNTTPGNSNGQR